MILAVIGLLMPALFVLTTGRHNFIEREVVSATVAVVLIALYAAALAFTFLTHEHLFHTPTEEEHAEWSVRKAGGLLLVATALVALEAELLVGALEPALEDLGLSKFFVGLILVPIVGNAVEHSSAVLFAHRDKVDVTLEIAIGSSTQIALFVAPALVFISLAVGHPMDFVFTTFEVAAVGLSALIVGLISLDGRSNWLEGAQLVGAYIIIARPSRAVQDLQRRIAPTPSRGAISEGTTRTEAPVASAERTAASTRRPCIGWLIPSWISSSGLSDRCDGSGPNHTSRSSCGSSWTSSTST